MLKEKLKLIRQERKLLNKIRSWNSYKIVIGLIFTLFPLRKKFLVLKWSSYKKILWIISITSFFAFKKKFWYIDDFIVHRNTRWKWVWKKIFNDTLKKLNKEESDYTFLVSRRDRKTSHKIYKNFWFKIISLWIWILAYKKFRKK